MMLLSAVAMLLASSNPWEMLSNKPAPKNCAEALELVDGLPKLVAPPTAKLNDYVKARDHLFSEEQPPEVAPDKLEAAAIKKMDELFKAKQDEVNALKQELKKGACTEANFTRATKGLQGLVDGFGKLLEDLFSAL